MTWTIITILVVESLTLGLAALPAILAWDWVYRRVWDRWPWPQLFVAMSMVPAYAIFAVALAAGSALGARLLGWRTPPPGAWTLDAMEWPVLRWACYMASIHVVRVFVGSVFRSSLLWTSYLRWNGARIGRGVYVNSLSISDHNMLEFGDGVIIGEGVHLSGHTVEAGTLKTGHVRLGPSVTVGLESVVGIGVTAGAHCQIAAMSVVPKHTTLEAGAVYAGAPVRLMPPADRA